jgi:hypothetical protein
MVLARSAAPLLIVLQGDCEKVEYTGKRRHRPAVAKK